MKKIVIVGCGPRGLAMALRASLYNYEIIIIDKDPLHTWKAPYMLEDIQMRSPISFDLTTLCQDLKQFSLPSFLHIDEKFNTQKEVEECNILCSRIDFINYLNYIYEYLKTLSNVTFIKQKVEIISNNSITCYHTKINYDYLIICSGYKTHTIDYPSYLKREPLITLRDILNKRYTSKYFNVIGSGQQAAEYVEFLARQNLYVTWLQKHKPIIKQYPVPSIQEWGLQSALGEYYSNLFRSDLKNEYLMKVKQWGPSITPYIASKLEEVSYSIINPETTEYINKKAHNILALGFKQEIKLLNFEFEIALDKQATNFPDIQKDFQSSSHSNIYFNGLLALRYDGPRQGSIISSAQTSNTIMQNILNN